MEAVAYRVKGDKCLVDLSLRRECWGGERMRKIFLCFVSFLVVSMLILPVYFVSAKPKEESVQVEIEFLGTDPSIPNYERFAIKVYNNKAHDIYQFMISREDGAHISHIINWANWMQDGEDGGSSNTWTAESKEYMITKGSMEQFNIYFSTQDFTYEWWAIDKHGNEMAFGEFDYPVFS